MLCAVTLPFGLARALVAVSAVAALAACGGDDGPEDDPFADLPLGTPSTSATTAPSAAEDVNLPKDCGDLLAPTAVLDALGVPLDGTTTYVYVGPLEGSGRLGRVTCGYGTAPGADGKQVAKLTVAVNVYADSAAASGRLDGSVADAQSAGAQVQALEVLGRPGFLTKDAEDTTFLVADDVRTYVISAMPGVIPDTAAQVALHDLARALVTRFEEAAPAGAPSSPAAPTTDG